MAKRQEDWAGGERCKRLMKEEQYTGRLGKEKQDMGRVSPSLDVVNWLPVGLALPATELTAFCQLCLENKSLTGFLLEAVSPEPGQVPLPAVPCRPRGAVCLKTPNM